MVLNKNNLCQQPRKMERECQLSHLESRRFPENKLTIPAITFSRPNFFSCPKRCSFGKQIGHFPFESIARERLFNIPVPTGFI